MKFLILYLNLLICFSTLLDQVRKEVVQNSLKKLPYRLNVDILKMFIEMSKVKEESSLNDAESAYFAYRWIITQIEYDCLGSKFGNSSTLPATIYKEGKGGAFGISALFNMICGFFNIESGSVFGLKKEITYIPTNLIEINEYAWNYIIIDNKYYLVDIKPGAGTCSPVDFKFNFNQNDEYFGIEPEASIRFLFPNDKKFQFLSEPITEDKFRLQAILDKYFLQNFASITPDIQTIRNQKEITIKLTVKDPSIKSLFFIVNYASTNSLGGSTPKTVPIQNGTFEYTLLLSNTCIASIIIKEDESRKSLGIISYEVIFDK